MSTYGTAAVVDVQGDAARDAVLREVADADGQAWPAPVGPPWRRVTLSLDDVEQVETVTGWLAGAGPARVAIAEDLDEYGARWLVLAVDGRDVRTVHRRYVLPADPTDPDDVASALAEFDEDPRSEDVGGPAAAAAAAELFGVDPAPVVQAEADSDVAFEELGVVGGPFPWWDALGLPWPSPAPDAG